MFDQSGVYTDTFRDSTYTFITVGSGNIRWHMESFVFERAMRESWWLIKPGDVVLDVGAGFGSYTLPALASGAERVIAVEPAKNELFSITQNVVLNKGFSERFVAIPMVLGSQDMCQVSFSPTTHSCVNFEGGHEDRLCVTGDGLLERLAVCRLDWIKIDVEGFEHQVILGLDVSIRKYRPRLLIEYHPGIVPNSEQLIRSILAPLNYREQTMRGAGVNDNWSLWEPC